MKMESKMHFEEDPKPPYKFETGDLVTAKGYGDVIVRWSWGRTRSGLGPWKNEYILCPLRADMKGPDMRTWNATNMYSVKKIRLEEDELTLVKKGFYIEGQDDESESDLDFD